MRQLIVYSGHFVEQAKNDSEVVGLLCELGHCSDSLMEGAHKKAKQGKYLFSQYLFFVESQERQGNKNIRRG